jgi:hypothetical protein
MRENTNKQIQGALVCLSLNVPVCTENDSHYSKSNVEKVEVALAIDDSDL